MKKLMMMSIMVTLVLSLSVPLYAQPKDSLVFGAIAVGKVSSVKKTLTPLLTYLEEKTGAKITFETGKDYLDTIAKFQSGHFDFGYIGPSPYIIATSGDEGIENFKILAGLETKGKPFFYACIIAAKDNAEINSLEDLPGKKFGFGSRQSTLSCYMPCMMLMEAGVFDQLSGYEFLGKHDIVVRNVAKGSVDAGGVKESEANKNLKRVKIIAKSDPVYDFLIVAHKSMDDGQYQTIKKALLELDDPKILEAVKPGVTGFIETDDSHYDNLRKVMSEVDKKLGTGK